MSEPAIVDPGTSPEVKAVVGFGTKSAMEGATPKGIKIFYRTLMFLSGLWALLEPYFPNIPVKIAHDIDKFILLGNVVIYYVCQQFGWVVPKTGNSTEDTTKV